jgi:hypothetical protein
MSAVGVHSAAMGPTTAPTAPFEPAPAAAPASRARVAAVVVFVVALVVRLRVVAAGPMPAGDGYDRLAHTDALVVHDWLPLYQAALDGAACVSRDVGWLRGANAATGALAAVAFGALVAGEAGLTLGLVGGLALALSPVHASASAGLYQEPLFVLLVCGGLVSIERRRGLGTALLAAATLTRYEGWLLAGVVGLLLVLRRDGPRPWGSVLALAAGPVAWLGFVGSRTPELPAGAPAAGFAGWLDISVAPARFLDQLRILRGLVPFWIGWPVFVLAAVGAFVVLAGASRRGRSAPFRGRPVPPLGLAGTALVLFGVLDGVFVTVFHPFSPPDNARQLHVPVLVASLLACRALAILPRRARIAGGVLLVLAFGGAGLRVARTPAAWDPGMLVRRAAGLGGELATRVGPDDRVLVLDPAGERAPGEEPSGCVAVMAYAALPRDRIVCDNEVPEAVGGGEMFLTWAGSERVRWVVWPLPEPGRWSDTPAPPPAHVLPVWRAVAALDAQLVEHGRAPRFRSVELPCLACGEGGGTRARREDDPALFVIDTP